MPTATFKIEPQGNGSYTVEMTKASGELRTFPDFVSESEAKAWIIQTKRLLQEVDPRPRQPPGSKHEALQLNWAAPCRPSWAAAVAVQL